MKMNTRLSLMALMVGALALTACQGMNPGDKAIPDVGDPDRAVAELRDAWEATPPDDPYASYRTEKGRKMPSRVLLRRKSENLLFKHPDHADGRMVAALMAYDAGNADEAARHLDYLLRLDPVAPDAALLRARIALEQGNPILARRLLAEQVQLRPDHAGLREAHASALYLSGDPAGALAELDEAERLGADPARVAYNRGLVSEGAGNTQAAVGHYQEALADRPGWRMPAERLEGLGVPHTAVVPASVHVDRADANAVAPSTAAPEKEEVPSFPPPAPMPPDCPSYRD
jgi:tetratricopeptide (TPR) repeat protein